MPESAPGAVRLDKWLWAARFFKTRSAATACANGGMVEVNGDRAKPARVIHPGDVIRLRLAPFEYRLEVTGIAERRGSASQAATLYRETDASRQARERLAQQLRDAPSLDFARGKPDKKDRRAIGKLKGKW
jgi:ribosome-associated heat shock protein Hsp15